MFNYFHKLNVLRIERIVVFLLIITLAAFIRFYSLNILPVSLYWDEVAQGYNAYSILMTGKDEYGSTFPLVFRSFDDFKMPLYIYLSTIVIKFFGLNEFSTRFISATAGTLTVVFTVFLTKKILEFGNYKNSEHIVSISYFSGLMLTVSPWHINFSRGAFEANLALFFVVVGLYFFISGMQNKKYLYISIIPFVCAFYSYRSILVFLPILISCSILIFNQYFRKKYLKHLIFFFTILAIFLSPLIITLFSGFSDNRVSQVSIFENSNQLLYENSIKQAKEGNTFWARLKYNRRITFSYIAFSNYISHFSPSFLFIDGDGNGRHSIRGMGMMYAWELPIIVIGIIISYRNFKDKRFFWFILFWLFSAPIPASLTQPAPHALRSLNILPVPQIFFSLGIIYLLSIVSRKQRIVLSVFVIMIIIFSLYIFSNKYKHHMINAGSEWGDGYKQLVTEVGNDYSDYDLFLVTGANWEPYIYFLYYNKFSPAEYQKNGSSISFDKYVFGGTSWDKDKKRKTLLELDLKNINNNSKSLLIVTPKEQNELPFNFYKIKEIRNNNNVTIYNIGKLL